MDLVKFSNLPTLFDRFFDDSFFDWSNRNFSSTNTTLPAVNIKDNPKSYDVEMAAPGLTKKDFNVELDNDVLTISSQKKEEGKKKEENFTRREFSYQSFSRSFTIPEAAESEKISAKYDDGILKISIPKKESAIPKPTKKIKIS